MVGAKSDGLIGQCLTICVQSPNTDGSNKDSVAPKSDGF